MMVRAEAPLVHCWCPVVFRHSGHHRKWANVSIISSGEGLHSATALLKSRVNSSQLPSDSFFLNIHLHFWHAERRKEGELTRERERERAVSGVGTVPAFPTLHLFRAPARIQAPVPNPKPYPPRTRQVTPRSQVFTSVCWNKAAT